MKRREFVAGCVSVVAAGVVGVTRADEFSASDDARSERLDGAGSASDPAESSAATDEPPESAKSRAKSASASSTESSAATLEVLSTTSGETDVRLELVRARDGEVVHDRVRTFAYGERAYLSGLCARGESYLFSLSVDDAELVREVVDPGETVVFELLDETTVSVVA